MNIDKVMALMPTIGHETQAKIRTALEHLVVSSREEAFCEAADAIGGLYSTKPRMSKADIAGMHGTLLGESYGKLSAEQKRANENTGADGDAATRSHPGMSALVSESAPIGAGSESPTTSRAGAERNAEGSYLGSVPASPAGEVEIPTPFGEVRAWWDGNEAMMLRVDRKAQVQRQYAHGVWELAVGNFHDALARRVRSLDIEASRAPRPASCSSCGDAWDIIANAHGSDWSKARDEWRSAATRWRDAWMKGERAPLPAPQPSVEEMAERLYGVFHHAPLDLPWTDLGSYIKSYWLALARAALSAMPASEELTDAEAQRLYDDAAKDAKPFSAHEVERFVRTTVDPQAEVLALQKQRNDVYEERDRLVAALSKCFPSWLARHPDTDKAWDDNWRWIVFVQLPTGQATWHIHDRERAWFDHLEVRENAWDGHTTEEKYRRLERLPAREAQSEPPTIEEITSLVHGGEIQTHEAWARCPECRPRAEEIRSLLLASRAPSPTLEECIRAAHEAIKSKHPHTAALAAMLTEDERECVLATRSLCLANRAPSPSPVKVNMREHANGVEVIEVLSDGSERSVVVIPLDCWSPSPEVAALVEAAERWAGTDGNDLIEMRRRSDPPRPLLPNCYQFEGLDMEYEGQKLISIRQCELTRLQKKLAKARHDRDQYRARCEAAERQVRWAVSDAWREERRKSDEAQRLQRYNLECDVKRLKALIADGVLDEIARRSRSSGGSA